MTDSAFPPIEASHLSHARDQALKALNHSDTPARIAAYYNPRRNFAGATFANLEPNSPREITATDLLAVTSLNVSIPVHGIRQILEVDEVRNPINDALQDLPRVALEWTADGDLVPMAVFYDLVKEQLSKAGVENGNPWVTASKVVARKRPDLFPVRDRVVCKFLGIDRFGDRAKDWSVFRALMNDEEIRSHLRELPQRAESAAQSTMSDTVTPIVLDAEPLRLLDVVLWMEGRSTEASD